MTYRILPEHLHPTADALKQYFKDARGLSGFKVEEGFDSKLEYRPTLHLHTKDQYVLCADVKESPYSSVLDSVVLDCIRRSLPVKLYVAFPGGINQTDYKRCVDRARQNGVGVLEVKPTGVEVIHEALALSLAGVRPIDTKKYPAKYRSALTHAESTFRGGAPVEGTLVIYSEIEALSRQMVDRTKAKGMWRPLRPGDKYPVLRKSSSWQRVLEAEIEHLDFSKCPTISKPLLGRILSVAPHRNDSGHKPKTLQELIKRDTELKTRFESASDLLLDLIKAVRPLKL